MRSTILIDFTGNNDMYMPAYSPIDMSIVLLLATVVQLL